ncbi:hypothetical protein K443DRAFT_682429 [Laccaria amethystina LaAM-08-1]|uniref:Uncharacterized protein n=1 Tax=Laccaria amethystina LaAM-08-1 TaxID=1095629 RepID=A0A0C9XF07_9AGAR|nr:hypothetical protein K443DRAFT_682429 [Laccaria amethystina LaAM-08-1]
MVDILALLSKFLWELPTSAPSALADETFEKGDDPSLAIAEEPSWEPLFCYEGGHLWYLSRSPLFKGLNPV